MKVIFNLNDKFTIEAEGDTHKVVFTKLAGLAEPFNVARCGACKSAEIVPVARDNEGNTFLEMHCRKCRARLSFGQNKQGGTIYPRRRFHKDSPHVKSGEFQVGDFIPNDGWERFARAEVERIE